MGILFRVNGDAFQKAVGHGGQQETGQDGDGGDDKDDGGGDDEGFHAASISISGGHGRDSAKREHLCRQFWQPCRQPVNVSGRWVGGGGTGVMRTSSGMAAGKKYLTESLTIHFLCRAIDGAIYPRKAQEVMLRSVKGGSGQLTRAQRD